MSVAIDNEISMNSIKDFEDDMSENLSHEIIGMENNTMDIEDAFLAGNASTPSSNVKTEPSEQSTNSQETTKANLKTKSLSHSKTLSSTIGNNSGQNTTSRTRAFRFVNNSPHSMYKQKSRMKPTFRVETQPVPNSQRLQNSNESVIIEQKFGNDGSDFQTTNDRKYVFQLNVKRPPGRPRKYPADQPKPKRPQGRPRKYPVEVTGTTINNSKVNKKPIKETSAHTLPIDIELIGTTKRGKGRPKREDKGMESHHMGEDAFEDERSFIIATAGATQSISDNSTNNGASSHMVLEDTKV